MLLLKKSVCTILFLFSSLCLAAQTVEPFPYGNFDSWVTRNIKESRVLGGHTRQVYAVGPTRTIDGDAAYDGAGTPWASSNVLAKVVGITKTSNAVYPEDRAGHGKCAKLCTQLESCKAIGLINIDVMVAGTLFLGKMFEPLKSTSDPYSKMEMGVPFTKRPVAMVYDYKLEIPDNPEILYSSGFGKKKRTPGADKAEAFVLLQRRWEDSAGNLYAKRVGTGRELLSKNTGEWVDGHKLDIHYGDITAQPFYKPYMKLIPDEKSYYARNSKGKMVPVREVGWDSADATPTHILVMFTSGSGEPYTGTPGMTFWVDNVAMQY